MPTMAQRGLDRQDDFTNTIYYCHFERSEKSKVGNRLASYDFRFLTAFGMTGKKFKMTSKKFGMTSKKFGMTTLGFVKSSFGHVSVDRYGIFGYNYGTWKADSACRGGGIGRHAALRALWPQGCRSSNLLLGTSNLTGRRSQVVKAGVCKTPIGGSNPPVASIEIQESPRALSRALFLGELT